VRLSGHFHKYPVLNDDPKRDLNLWMDSCLDTRPVGPVDNRPRLGVSLLTPGSGLSRSILQSRPSDRVRGRRRVGLYRAEPGQGGAGEATRALSGQRSAAVSWELPGKSPWRFWGWIYHVLGFEEDPQGPSGASLTVRERRSSIEEGASSSFR